MNNNIVFDTDNNTTDSNSELLKSNTPNTVDYNSLYNTQQNIINQNNNTKTNINSNPNNNNNNIINATIENTTQDKKKKGIDSLLFVFLLFIFIMGIIMFLFPILASYLFG